MLKTIAIFLIIYFVIWFFAFFVFPRLVKWYIRRITRKFSGKQNNGQEYYSKKRKNNNVRIFYNDNNNKKDQIPDDIGEYVDFEEIKDKSRKK